MRKQLQYFISPIVATAAFAWRLVPSRLRDWFIAGLVVLESRSGQPADGLRRLFRLQDTLDWVTNERAMAYERGVHPKHRLTRYHDFFVNHIPPGSRVLDIGCGYGAVARSVATRVPGSTVVGVDVDKGRLAQARAGEVPVNLSFVEADARTSLPTGPWTVVILSNVLEHIENRVGFLLDILRHAQPQLVLIRVPLFERDWRLPLRRELGVGYFSDPTHFIEHRLDELRDEATRSGLTIVDTKTFWGEIWVKCVPPA